MAKGNNGNLLQHVVETEIVRELWIDNESTRFNLIVTHGMAPFEPLGSAGGPGTKLFCDWLDIAIGRPRKRRFVDENSWPAIVAAYRRCRTTYLYYPNTAELVAAIVGRERIAGYVCEFEDQIADEIEAAWQETELNLHRGDWRNHIGYIASCDPIGPWLVSMDPMTFEVGGSSTESANFHQGDFQLVEDLARDRLRSEFSGCFCLFCYSMSEEREQEFRQAATAFSANLDREPAFLRVQAANGRDHRPRHHVVLLISNMPGLTSTIGAIWGRVAAGPSHWQSSTADVSVTE